MPDHDRQELPDAGSPQLHELIESFCAHLEEKLAELIREPVSLRVAGCEGEEGAALIERLAESRGADQLVLGVSQGSCWIGQWDSSLLLTLIQCMLGGRVSREPPRKLSSVEMRLAERLGQILLEGFRTAWQPVRKLDFRSLTEKNERHLALAMIRQQPVVGVEIAVTCGDVRGTIQLAIPAACEKQPPRPPTKTTAHAPAELVLGPLQLNRIELLQLRVGDVLPTDVPVDQPLDFAVDGKVVFRAKPGAFRGRKAAHLLEPQPDDSPPLEEEA